LRSQAGYPFEPKEFGHRCYSGFEWLDVFCRPNHTRRKDVKRFLLAAAFALLASGTADVAQAQWWSSECSGLVGGVDITAFRLYGNQGAGGDSNVGNIDDYFPDYGFVGDARIWFGYEGPNGMGIRARIFEWEESQLYNGSVRTQDIEVYDLEATLDMSVCAWEFTGFGGLRWSSIELNGTDFGGVDPMDFEGAGLTMGVDVRRCLWRDISLVGGVRYSVLYGETTFAPTSTAVLDNTFVDITEMRLGLEWARELGIGGRLFVSAVWEQQVYGTDTYMPFAIDPETLGDVSLAGPVFSIGIDR